MMATRRVSLWRNGKKHRLMPIAWMIIITMILSLFSANVGLSAPIIVSGDSDGYWLDSFEDNTGISERVNVSVLDGDVSLHQTEWYKHGVVVNNGGTYDTITADTPCVLKEGGTYKMWYRGYDGTEGRILYATSFDGITWSKQGFVLEKGNPGDYDANYVFLPQVINVSGEFKMWYAGNDGGIDRIMYANSSDGINWVKQGLAFTDTDVRPNTVMHDGGIYKMWYQEPSGNYRIYYATSLDGLTWTKQGLALNKGAPGELDDLLVSGAAVVIESENLYGMWYSGHDGSTGYRIFWTASSDGINWEKQGLAVNIGGPGELDGTDVMYCDVMKDDDGMYKMWYSGRNDSGEVRTFYATSPYLVTNGYIRSISIILPSGYTWESLSINKTELGSDCYLNITVLDGMTNLPIPGFINLTGTNIDISSIDNLTYPILRLYASFVGNGSVSPVLHDWKVVWIDTIPPDTPTGLNITVVPTGNILNIS